DKPTRSVGVGVAAVHDTVDAALAQQLHPLLNREVAAVRVTHDADAHTSPRRFRLASDSLHEGLDEKVIAPGHRFVDAQSFVVMIEAVQKYSFPLRLIARQKVLRTERLQQDQTRGTIALLFRRVRNRLGKIP